MFGFIIGSLSLLGFIAVWRGGRRRGRQGHGGPRRWFLRRLFHHLDATPGQEKVIQAAMEGVERAGWRARDQMRQTRAGVAKALRGTPLDSTALGEAFAAQRAALEPAQRQRLADLIEFGPRRMHGGCGASC